MALIYKKTGNLRACQLLLGPQAEAEHGPSRLQPLPDPADLLAEDRIAVLFIGPDRPAQDDHEIRSGEVQIGEIKRRVQIADGIASPGEGLGEGAPVFRGEVMNGDAGAERAGWGPPGSIGQGSRRRRRERPPHRTVGSCRRRTRHER